MIRAKDLYYNWDAWKEVRTRAMRCDTSWSRSAESYKYLYLDMKNTV